MRRRARSWRSRWVSVSSAVAANNVAAARRSSGRRRERRAGIVADALHHRTKAVRALRREVLAQAEAIEYRDGIGVEDVARRLAGVERKQDGDEPAHDVRVAVTDEIEPWAVGAVGPDLAGEPDLAGASLDLVGVGTLRLGQRRERPPEFDHVAVAIVPIVEERKVVRDLVDGHAVAEVRKP